MKTYFNDLADCIKKNRFHLQAQGVRALADFFEVRHLDFDRDLFYARIEGKPYQPKTGAPCSCRRGQERDNCPSCEGTGERIDFAKIRELRA